VIEDRKALLARNDLVRGDYPEVAHATKHSGFNGLEVRGLTAEMEEWILGKEDKVMLANIIFWVVLAFIVQGLFSWCDIDRW